MTERSTGKSWLVTFSKQLNDYTYLFVRGMHGYYVSRRSGRYDIRKPQLYRTRMRGYQRRNPGRLSIY